MTRQRERGEYVNPSRDEMLRENAERMKRLLEQQEQEARAARPRRSVDRVPASLRRIGYVPARSGEGGC